MESLRKPAKPSSRKRRDDDAFDEEADSSSPVAAEKKPKKKKKAASATLQKQDSLALDTGASTGLVRSTSMLSAKEWVPLDPQVDAEPHQLKVVSFNINGIRAFLNRALLDKYIEEEKPDILCFQETKTNPEKKDGVPKVLEKEFPHQYWSHSKRPAAVGYAGTAILSRVPPLDVTYGIGQEKFDLEGRVITLEFEGVYLVASYHPNSGKGGMDSSTKLPAGLPARNTFDAAFEKFLAALQERKPVLIVGDLNVAPQACDLFNPKGNVRNAGYTEQERANFKKLTEQRELVDVWRHFNPVSEEHATKGMGDQGAYSYWSVRRGDARLTNKGWRVDIMLADSKVLDTIASPFMRKEVRGSDHCAIGFLTDKKLFQKQ